MADMEHSVVGVLISWGIQDFGTQRPGVLFSGFATDELCDLGQISEGL